MSNIYLAFQITLIGMLLIFSAMILLWTILSLSIFLLTKMQPSPAPEQEYEVKEESDELERMRQHAVAVAVTTALHQRSMAGPGRFPLPPTAFVSAWQAVLRSHILNKRGMIK